MLKPIILSSILFITKSSQAWYFQNFRNWNTRIPNYSNSPQNYRNYYYSTNIVYPRNPVYVSPCDIIKTSQTKRGSVGTMGMRNSGDSKCWEIQGANPGSTLRVKLTHLQEENNNQICNSLKINGNSICDLQKIKK